MVILLKEKLCGFSRSFFISDDDVRQRRVIQFPNSTVLNVEAIQSLLKDISKQKV